MVKESSTHLGTTKSQVYILAGVEVGERQPCLHGIQRHREHRIVHLRFKDIPDTSLFHQVARHNLKVTILVKGRRKKWKPVDMIPMGVGQQNMAIFLIMIHHLFTKISNSGAAVEQNLTSTDINLKARRVTAIF